MANPSDSLAIPFQTALTASRNRGIGFLVAGFCSSDLLNYLDDRADGNPGRPFGSIGLRVIAPGCSGDVQMRPRDSVCKLFEKGGGGDCSGLAPADVFDVRDVGLDLLGVFLVERKLPVFFADL